MPNGTDISPVSNTDISDTTSDTNQPTTDPNNPGSTEQDAKGGAGAAPDDGSGEAGQVTGIEPQQGTPDQQSDQQQVAPFANAGSGRRTGAMLSNKPKSDNDPAIQHASRFYKVAEALAGGPRYKTTIDPNTGQMTRTQVPLSRGDLGMAIAMEAISGAMSGLQQKGPNATKASVAAGFDTVMQQRKEQDQQQQQQATADYARHAQIMDTNLRMHQIAQNLGRQDFETNQGYTAQYQSLANQLQKEHPEIVKGLVNESDLSKYHVAKDSALPVNVVPRLDPATGKQSTDQYGAPQWDVQYLVVDPSIKSDDFLSEDDKAEAAKFRLPGFANSDGSPSNLPQSLPMRLSMALNYKARIAALKLSDQDVSAYYKKMGGDAPSLVDAVKQDPTIVEAMEKFQPLLNATGQNYAKAIGELGAKDPQAAGKILNLYGGTTMVNKFDQQKADEEDAAKKKAEAQEAINKERALVPVRARQAGAEEAARLSAKDQHDNLADSAAAHAALSETPQNGVRLGYLATLPPERGALIREIGEGRMPISAYAVGKGSEGTKLAQQVALAYPGYDATRAPTYEKTRQAFTSGKVADGVNSLNAAMQHMMVMYSNASWLGSTPGVSAVARGVGNQSAVDLANSKAALVDELGKAYKAGALTDQDVKTWKNRIEVWSPNEIRANAHSFMTLLDGKLGAYEHQWNEGAPPAAVPPVQIMSPEAASAYQSIMGRPPRTGSGQSGQPISSHSNTSTQQPSNQTAPAGATGKAQSPADHKWYYHDANGRNLGPVQ